MMCRLAIVVLLAFPVIASSAAAGPLKFYKAGRRRVEKDKALTFKWPFKGGERACVLVEGDRDPSMKISVKVYDVKTKRLVGEDTFEDFCAVIWYPPRDGEYRIEIALHNAPIYNLCFIALK